MAANCERAPNASSVRFKVSGVWLKSWSMRNRCSPPTCCGSSTPRGTATGQGTKRRSLRKWSVRRRPVHPPTPLHYHQPSPPFLVPLPSASTSQSFGFASKAMPAPLGREPQPPVHGHRTDGGSENFDSFNRWALGAAWEIQSTHDAR